MYVKLKDAKRSLSGKKNMKCNSKCHSNSSAKINKLRHCSSVGLRYMYFLSINY